MINGLNILNIYTNSHGTINDSVDCANGQICLVGNFTTVNSFSTTSIALINSATGLLDSTSSLAIALSNLFLPGTTINRVLYTVSSGHPCLIFLTGETALNQCYVFFTDVLTGYNLLQSTALAFTQPYTQAMNSAWYQDMAICSAQNTLAVIGSFYISGINGCVTININSMYGGTSNSSVVSGVGSAQNSNVANSYSTNFTALTIDNANSILYLQNQGTFIIGYTISSGSLTFYSSLNTSINNSAATPQQNARMTFGNNQIFLTYYTAINIFSYNTLTLTWGTTIRITKSQFNNEPYVYGIYASSTNLYVWGNFNNIGLATDLNFANRNGLAVYNITGTTPKLTGEDLALSYGTIFINQIGLLLNQQTATIIRTHIDTDAIYLFPIFSLNYYGITSSGTGINPQTNIFKNGILNLQSPIRASLNGYDLETSNANLTY